MIRTNTLAEYAELVYHFTDLLLAAIRSGDLDEIEEMLAEIKAFLPPDGVDPSVALAVVLAAQIDPSRSAEDRLSWVRGFDPAVAA